MFRKRPELPKRGMVPDDQERERVFKIYRDYIQHEDLLVNHRMTWLITIQSFLWATFGFAFQKRNEVLGRMFVEILAVGDLAALLSQYNTLLYLLGMVGVLTSIGSAISVNAARQAVKRLRQSWQESRYFLPQPASHLPGLTDGGGAGRFNSYTTFLLPFVLTLMWVSAQRAKTPMPEDVRL